MYLHKSGWKIIFPCLGKPMGQNISRISDTGISTPAYIYVSIPAYIYVTTPAYIYVSTPAYIYVSTPAYIGELCSL